MDARAVRRVRRAEGVTECRALIGLALFEPGEVARSDTELARFFDTVAQSVGLDLVACDDHRAALKEVRVDAIIARTLTKFAD